jgi:hypothetical protein
MLMERSIAPSICDTNLLPKTKLTPLGRRASRITRQLRRRCPPVPLRQIRGFSKQYTQLGHPIGDLLPLQLTKPYSALVSLNTDSIK